MEGSIAEVLQALAQMWPGVGYILMGLGALVVLGRLYVGMTPSQEDDAWFARLEELPVVGVLLKVLASFSPVQRGVRAQSLAPKKKK